MPNSLDDRNHLPNQARINAQETSRKPVGNLDDIAAQFERSSGNAQSMPQGGSFSTKGRRCSLPLDVRFFATLVWRKQESD
jgi:hypothetical protein